MEDNTFFAGRIAAELVEARLIKYAKKEGWSHDEIIALIVCNKEEIQKFVDQLGLAYIWAVNNWTQKFLLKDEL